MPHYDLEKVKALVRAGDVRFEYSNTILKVCERLYAEHVHEGEVPHEVEAKAIDLICSAITTLDAKGFHRTFPAVKKATPLDAYGLQDGDGRTWYVKFRVGTGVRVVSFHRPEHDVATVGGVLTK